MKLGSVYFEGDARIAVDMGHNQVAVVGRSGDTCPSAMKVLVKDWPAMLPRLLECLSTAPRIEAGNLRWLPPLPDPTRLLSVSVSCSDGRPRRLVWKSAASLIGHRQPISLKAAFGSVTANAALALVIGEHTMQRGLHGMTVPVFGFAPFTNLSGRNVATLETHVGGYAAVEADAFACGLENFAPMGPFMVVDEDIAAQVASSMVRVSVSEHEEIQGETSLLLESARMWLPGIARLANLHAGDVVAFSFELTRSSELMEARGDFTTTIDGVGALSNPLQQLPIREHAP
ncbi:fumarylacetoacetate hydrolase family protein [Paraburkholderia sp. MM5477-R1]|uniref:fumarylacetoacetate hydrolase family protein n=1 Tax=Paraburkholderia sp. MM5477-R1 TaxID=2991062 RepID=UPI003D2211AB